MSSRRHVVLGLALAALGATSASFAQNTRKAARIGFLSSESPSDPAQAARLEALRSALRERGYQEPGTIIIELRWAQGRYDRLHALAAELVALDVEAIV